MRIEVIEHVHLNTQITERLSCDYNIKVKELLFLPLGADTDALTYKAQSFDGLSYFVKLKQGHHSDVGIEVLKLLQNAGVKQVIPPIKTIHGESTQIFHDYTLIVYPFIEGQNGFSNALTEEQWTLLGKALKQMHELKVPKSIKSKIRKETYTSKWRNSVRSSISQIDDITATDDVALKLQKFMKMNMPTIQKLLDYAESLSEKLQNSLLEFVLCHSDIHAGNVLLSKDSDIYIVDFDEPILAPRERDLMFIGGGVGNVWNRPQEEKLFFLGYGEVDIDSTALAYYRCERINEDIAIYCSEVFQRETALEEKLKMYKHFLAMFEQNGVVDIALATISSLPD
ncbi:MAG: Stress response kinase A [Chlamydiia bacterium]|nr:Stress response kinase A [Chlamydiia bacterium]